MFDKQKKREESEMQLSSVLRFLAGNAGALAESEVRHTVVLAVLAEPDPAAALEEVLRLCGRNAAERSEQINALQVALEKLQQEVRDLLAPPVYEALLLSTRKVNGERRATVAASGRRWEVQVAQEVSDCELEPGRVALINQDQNCLLEVGNLWPAGRLASVTRRLDDGRLILDHQGGEFLVEPLGQLRQVALEAGDLVRFDEYTCVALESLGKREMADLLVTEPPDVTFDDIGGLDEVITPLCIDLALQHNCPKLLEAYDEPEVIRGTTFYGPPGCGKTMVAKALCNYVEGLNGHGDTHFVVVKPGQFHTMWFGETERKQREFFDYLRRLGGFVYCFFDELDAFGRIRGETIGHAADAALQAFLTELDGFHGRGATFLTAATNRLDLCDPALVREGRFGDCKVEIPRPDYGAAVDILLKYLRRKPLYGVNGDEKARLERAEEWAAGLIDFAFSRNGDNQVCRLVLADGTREVVRFPHLISGALLCETVRGATRRAMRRDYELGGKAQGLRESDLRESLLERFQGLAQTLTPRNLKHWLPDWPVELVEQVHTVERPEPIAGSHRYLRGH